MSKLAQRQLILSSYTVNISLIDNSGYIYMRDNGLYPDEDSRSLKKELGFNNTIIGPISRESLKNLKIAITEVLKNSK